MHRLFAAGTLAVSLAVGALAAPARAADSAGNDPAKTFSDGICPAATPPVRQFYVLGANPNTPVDDFLGNIRGIIDVYERCRSEKLTNGSVREVHYAETRLAQFHFEAGHMQRLVDQAAEAKQSLSAGLDLANDVANWAPSSQSVYQSNNVGVGSGSNHAAGTDRSPYYDSAVAIRDAIAKELTLLANPAPSTTSVPQADPTATPPSKT